MAALSKLVRTSRVQFGRVPVKHFRTELSFPKTLMIYEARKRA